jgi:hypothetical protein
MAFLPIVGRVASAAMSRSKTPGRHLLLQTHSRPLDTTTKKTVNLVMCATYNFSDHVSVIYQDYRVVAMVAC